MPLTDPLGDMLTRIRNGQQARKDSVMSPASKLRVRVLVRHALDTQLDTQLGAGLGHWTPRRHKVGGLRD